MKSCSKCVMPETAEALSFDNQGVCSVCRGIEIKHEKIDWASREVEFEEILSRYRGTGDYDCIIPFSGGKDSTFILYHMVKVRKMKPLVVRFDHGFLRPQVMENSLRAFRTLGVDVLHFTPNWQVVRKLMLEALRRRGDFCWHCHTGIYSYPMWVALRYDVPLVIWGENLAEYSSFYSYEDAGDVDERFFNRMVNLGINAEDMLEMLDDTVTDYPVEARDLKPFTYPPMVELRRKKVASLSLGYFINWDTKANVKLIKDELGWKGDEVEGVPPEYDYEKIECFMQGVRDYIKYLKRGFGRTTHVTSIDIREGRMDRETAEALVAKHDGKRPPSLDLFLDFLGLSEESFMEIVSDHVVAPHVMPTLEEVHATAPNKRLHDFDVWPRISGDRK